MNRLSSHRIAVRLRRLLALRAFSKPLPEKCMADALDLRRIDLS